ncbi:MAG: hypothetical protein HY840_11535 [Bacteroidetes bacterium]|nr:hypothetical protein [Bacteroidota bacterium]
MKKRFKHKFSDEEVSHSLDRIIYEAIQLDDIKEVTFRKKRKDNGSGDNVDNLEPNDTFVSSDSKSSSE